MKSYDIAVQKTSEQTGIPIMTIRKWYRAYWKLIKDKIEALPLKDDLLTEEEFNKLNTVFNIPSLGKMYCTYKNYIETREKEQKRRERYAKNHKGASNV